MKAPTEKHLEDWIVANPDKMMPEYWQASHGDYLPLIQEIIRRQPRFPNGRPDIVFKSHGSVCVMELKKGMIKSSTVTQCLRYMYDLRGIGYSKHVHNASMGNEDLPIPEIEDGAIKGFVVGRGIEDDNLLLACDVMNITPITYDFDGENYTFDYLYHRDGPDVHNCHRDWADGAIGDAFMEAMHELKRQHQNRKALMGGES